MEFDNESLINMDVKKHVFNNTYAKWYYGISQELYKSINENTGEIQIIDNKRYLNKADRINNCMNLWSWDAYHENKVLDLKTVNRCKNNRFCPNCRHLEISKFVHKSKDIIAEYIMQGYKMYILTLTIPNVNSDELEPTLKKLSKSTYKFFEKYNNESDSAYKNRSINIYGGIKVLEITHNVLNDSYHPHYHCIVLSKDINEKLLKKDIIGKYSIKRNADTYKSYIDCELGLIWSLIWQNIKITKKNIQKYEYIPKNIKLNENEDYKVLEVDFREMDKRGFYEVFKYTFKDADIRNYNTFKTLEFALDGKRIRQGFGNMYNVKCEDIEEGEIQILSLEKEEEPVDLLTREINELYTTYKNYKKISRFNSQLDNNIK